MLKLFTLSIVLSISTAACGQMTEFDKIDTRSDQVVLYKLGPADTNTPEAALLAGWAITASHQLETDKKKALLKAMLDKDNYVAVSRRCQMEPTYAIKIDGALVALFDPQFCPRIEYLGGSESIRYDIQTENSILKAMESIKFDQ